jgi:hypothetical protein
MNHWLGIFGLDAESITRTVNQVKQVASTDNEGSDAKPVAAAKKTRKRSSSASKAMNTSDAGPAGDAEVKGTPEDAGAEAAEVGETHEAGKDTKEAAKVKEKSEADGVVAAEVKGGTQDRKVDEKGSNYDSNSKPTTVPVEAETAESTKEGQDKKEGVDEL